MSETAEVTVTLNSEVLVRAVPVRRNLADFLRIDAGLTGTHVGCEQGVCGACTVVLNGQIVRSCLLLAVQADGCTVDTIEGASQRGELRYLQDAFHKRNALQCGFCTPGMLLTAHKLIQTEPELTRTNVREYLSGNYCRCTGYQAIVDAIMAAAKGEEAETKPPSAEFEAIGQSLPRPRARRLLEGQGRYTDDIVLARTLHVAFLRSSHPHARIVAIDSAAASKMPGVVRIVTGAEIAEHCQPYAGMHQMFPTMRVPDQLPLAVDVARWQGEPVLAVVAETRAQAEDAVELVEITWEPLPALTDPRVAMTADAPVIHDSLGTNVAFDAVETKGDVDDVFRQAKVVVEADFNFARQTGVCLEPRTIIADYKSSDESLTVHQSHQCPAQQQDNFAQLLGLAENKVRVICPDIGGAFGIKQQLYGDELAVCVLSKLLGRPIKFVADRLESMTSDIHCREHRVAARIAVAADGRFLAFDVDDCFGVGAYSQFPRSSIGEGSHVLRLTGAPYSLEAYRARLRMVLQNKNMIGHYRAVGVPVAVAITEALVDEAARKLDMDPIEIRRRNYVPESAYPYKSHGGFTLEQLSQHACLDKLVSLMDIPKLRAEQEELRKRGVYRGIGICSFVEISGTGPLYYGKGGVRLSAQEGCLVKLEPTGTFRCFPSVTDQGQGIDTGIGQIVSHVLGVPFEDVSVTAGDSEFAPYGGGAWASRGAYVGGEAAYSAASALRENILSIAASILQARPDQITIRGRAIVNVGDGRERMALAEVARIGYFRQDLLPSNIQPELSVVRHYVPQKRPFLMSNGIQGSWVEVDIETGFVRPLRHYMVHDAGAIINPMLADGQIRGGIVQGIGEALYEEIAYGENGELLTGTLADYLVPMSFETPDIEIDHVNVPVPDTQLGVKGLGEAGTVGAPGAILNAVNDALSPFSARLTQLPLTPERVLRALGTIQ